MKAVKITDKVYWVGAIDWKLRDFHGYTTGRGSTYNAYLILADKITLIDTVKSPFRDEMLARISSLIEPKDISYIVSNHTEMDHSGCLPEIIERTDPEKVFASKMGVKGLNRHFKFNMELTEVNNGENLSLGNMNLTFFETKMLHWPDSMFTLLDEGGVLFSQDAFGMHLASNERYADEIDPDILRFEAAKYYANILTPYSSLILKLKETIEKAGIKFSIIAPDHGPVWRNNLSQVINWYTKWAVQKPTNKAVLVFDTMWRSTARMAASIAEGIKSRGAAAALMPLSENNRSDVATELLEAGALVVGSPTINNQMFPSVADVLCYIKGLKFQNLVGGAFGSYGWSGEAVKLIVSELQAMKIRLISDPVNIKWRPSETDLAGCFEYGRLIGDNLNA